MKFIRGVFFLVLPFTLGAQAKFEVREYTGIVKSIEPGFVFALERMNLEVDGSPESFLFYPYYGTVITEKVKVGDVITLKANVNLRSRALLKDLTEANRQLSWFLMRDHITEIKIGNEWIALPEKKGDAAEQTIQKVFLDRPVVNVIQQGGYNRGLVFNDGLVGFNQGIGKYYDVLQSTKRGDEVSFVGVLMPKKNGYVYSIDPVKETYHINPLTKKTGTLKSYLFKQNFACIGVKFEIIEEEQKKALNLSFPGTEAKRIKAFLQPGEELRIYYGTYSLPQLGEGDLPELQAIIQGRDTLFVNKFGFYGGADGHHEHKQVQVTGKITKVNRSAKGNVLSFLVGTDGFVEIDALMAQQLGHNFTKGTEITVHGQERIKKEGEIYQKDYRIITPEKIVINGKEFSRYQP